MHHELMSVDMREINVNKKLRYRGAKSTAPLSCLVGVGYCMTYLRSGKNLLMTTQPLLRNGLRKLGLYRVRRNNTK